MRAGAVHLLCKHKSKVLFQTVTQKEASNKKRHKDQKVRKRLEST